MQILGWSEATSFCQIFELWLKLVKRNIVVGLSLICNGNINTVRVRYPTSSVIERPFLPITGFSISGWQRWRPFIRYHVLLSNTNRIWYPDQISVILRTKMAAILPFYLISSPDIECIGYRWPSCFSITEPKSVRILKFSGYRASGYRTPTVNDVMQIFHGPWQIISTYYGNHDFRPDNFFDTHLPFLRRYV
jgi:hypothetical protein